MAFTAGQKVRASALNQIGVIVGRSQRTTNSTASATIVRVLSVIAPVVAGRSYRVWCDGEIFSTSTACVAQSELRYTTNNTEPATSSTVLGRSLTPTAAGGTPNMCHIEAFFHAVSTGTLRVAVTTTRVVGADTVSWTADATYPMLLVVEDIGDTISTTGTIY